VWVANLGICFWDCLFWGFCFWVCFLCFSAFLPWVFVFFGMGEFRSFWTFLIFGMGEFLGIFGVLEFWSFGVWAFGVLEFWSPEFGVEELWSSGHCLFS
jgi:hypothetical protein